MSKIENFLTPKQEEFIIKAIEAAENNTSGEIRVHIEKFTKKPPMDRALEVFCFLKMNETKLKNGVLIYVAIDSKKFAIIGDEGIDKVVSDNFWEKSKELMLSNFKNGEYAKGIEIAVLEVGNQLKKYFPKQQNDRDELSNEISKS